MPLIFIDGQEGTTGLQIHERLAGRSDIALMEIPSDKRKDPIVKKEFLNKADIVILCLPDDAARESVSMIENPATCVIDASTAHRTAQGWVYGFPELNKNQRANIKSATRIANPGCHATGFVSIVNPLITTGIIPADFPVTATSLTGYSGGGKKLISAYDAISKSGDGSRVQCPYALTLKHKHIPEMQKWSGLAFAPLFMPVVGQYYKGIIVSVPLTLRQLPVRHSREEIHAKLAVFYADEPFVKVVPLDSESSLVDGFLSPTACNDTNRLEIFVFGNAEMVLISARFDNLGKGASGAAVQNLNLRLGFDERTGLVA